MKFLPVLLMIPFLLNAQQVYFPQDTIAYDNRFNNREYAAYDAQGKMHISYSGQLGTNSATGEIYYLKEEDNGSFTKTSVTNNNFSDNYPTLSLDVNGKVHIGYIGRDAVNFQIKYTHNISGTFIPPIEITTAGVNKATPFSKIGPDSVMHFVYFTYTDGNDYAFYRYYDLRTSTLSNEIYLANSEASGDFEATLDIDSQGKVHVALKSGGYSGQLKYFNNKTGTITEYPTGVIVNVTYPRITLDNSDNVHIVYRNTSGGRLEYLNNIGGTFTTPVPVTPVGQLPSGFQNFAIDDDNNIYIVYQSSQSASGKGFYLVFADNGVFTDTIKVSDITPAYVTRNSSMIIAKGNGDFTTFYAPGGMRNDTVICDIFSKTGNIFDIVPVELESFTAQYSDGQILLNWITASELNNRGFEIHSSPDNINFNTAGFLSGKGNSTVKNNYSFIDKRIFTPVTYYKLVQIDYDGTKNKVAETMVKTGGNEVSFDLMQNYPNPFNPSTTIKYRIAEKSFVTLNVYDVLGNQIESLVNSEKNSGVYEVNLDASAYTSGVYFYTITAGSFTASKKFILLK